MKNRTDWAEVERIMGRCVRGSGYLLSKSESSMLDRALKEDEERYVRLHSQVKGEAADEIWPTGGA